MADSKTATKKRDKNAASKTVANPDGSNRLFTLAILGILVLGLAGVAFVVTQREGTNFDGDQTADVELEGEPLVQMPTSGVTIDPASDPVIGSPLPVISGTGFNDEPITIEDDGRAKVVYFLAHWCPHCQAEVPRVVELIEDGKQPEDLDIYGISTSVDASRGGAYPPANWFDREGFDVPVIRDNDSSSALTYFGGGGFPYTVYVDADNNIVARSSGELDPATIENLWNLAVSAPTGSE